MVELFRHTRIKHVQLFIVTRSHAATVNDRRTTISGTAEG